MAFSCRGTCNGDTSYSGGSCLFVTSGGIIISRLLFSRVGDNGIAGRMRAREPMREKRVAASRPCSKGGQEIIGQNGRIFQMLLLAETRVQRAQYRKAVA